MAVNRHETWTTASSSYFASDTSTISNDYEQGVGRTLFGLMRSAGDQLEEFVDKVSEWRRPQPIPRPHINPIRTSQRLPHLPSPTVINPEPQDFEFSPKLTSDGRLVLFEVRVLWDYASQLPDELDLTAGDVVSVTDASSDGWWSGENTDETKRVDGRHLFPGNLVELPQGLSLPAEAEGSEISEETRSIFAENGERILFYVTALYDFPASAEDEMDLAEGDIVAVTSTPPNGWWSGEHLVPTKRVVGRSIFPSNFVQLRENTQTQINEELILFYVTALSDYEATDEATFSFKEGDKIGVLQTSRDGWWTGRLIDGDRILQRRNLFPITLVDLAAPTHSTYRPSSPPPPSIRQSLVSEFGTMTTVSFDLPPLPELCGTFVPLAVKPLDQTNLKLAQFGSRFLPHSTSQIRCILPIPGTPLILIGSDDGLSVLDMYPQEWKDGEIIDVHGPNEARAKPIWIGQGVFQIDMLEQPNDKNSGIVLALVGANSTTSSPAMRTVRMYNLGSLTSLAKWTVGPYGSQPLDLSRGPANPRRSESLTVNLRSRLAGALKLGKVESISPSSLKPFSIEEKSTWDIVDSLPLQWASDFVSLAAHNSRLDRVDIRCYKLWSIDRIQKLAIGTKSAIWLYESPYGERAFRFIKDYYIPFKPKMIDFFLQSVPSSSNQLCLLVIFENGAGWIRLADSAVGKFNLRYNSPITSFSKINLPIMPSNPFHDDSQNIHDLSPNVQETYIVTQGEVTHILPSPIPSTSSLPTQYKTIRWLQSPTSAMARVVRSTDVQSTTHMLQVVGLGPSGVEVQVHEVASLQWQESNSLDSYLPNPVSSPKTSSSISLQEIGGTSGFLSFGGHWDSLRLSYRLSRSDPILYEKLDSKVRSKEGMYCWVQKGAEDFRVFWLGGRRERSASNDSNFDVQI